MILGRGMIEWPKEIERLVEKLGEGHVAETTGVTRATVRKWIEGESSPRGRYAVRIAELIEQHQ